MARDDDGGPQLLLEQEVLEGALRRLDARVHELTRRARVVDVARDRVDVHHAAVPPPAWLGMGLGSGLGSGFGLGSGLGLASRSGLGLGSAGLRGALRLTLTLTLALTLARCRRASRLPRPR